MNNPAQIIHESETQRQFIRLQLPAMVDVKEQRFTVKDLSSGGMAIRDIDHHFSKGDLIETKLILPFADFSLDIGIKGEVQYIDKKANCAGVRFIDLNANQISILNHVIKSFMAGDIIGSQDLLNVVSRENFVNVRKHASNQSESSGDKIKKYSIYGLVVVATLLLSAFIINNILEKMFILKTPYGFVKAQNIEILSPAAGYFETSLSSSAISVKTGQVLGTIKRQDPEGIALVKNIVSPCDCFIKDTLILENEYKPQDTKLFNLIPQAGEITVRAFVMTKDIHRLNIGTEAIINISGVSDLYKGKVINIMSSQEPQPLAQEPTSLVVIQTDQRLNNDLVDRPAFIEFHL